MITVKTNGKDENLEKEMTLLGFIDSVGLDKDKIIIELNFKIMPKSDWNIIILKENDNLEILSLVSGG